MHCKAARPGVITSSTEPFPLLQLHSAAIVREAAFHYKLNRAFPAPTTGDSNSSCIASFPFITSSTEPFPLPHLCARAENRHCWQNYKLSRAPPASTTAERWISLQNGYTHAVARRLLCTSIISSQTKGKDSPTPTCTIDNRNKPCFHLSSGHPVVTEFSIPDKLSGL